MVTLRSGRVINNYTVWTPKRVRWSTRRVRTPSPRYATPKSLPRATRLNFARSPYISPLVNRSRLIRRSIVSSPKLARLRYWGARGARSAWAGSKVLGKQALYSRGLGGALTAYWLYRAGRKNYNRRYKKYTSKYA